MRIQVKIDPWLPLIAGFILKRDIGNILGWNVDMKVSSRFAKDLES